MFGNNEYRIGVFFGAVACVLVLALTVMAFVALEPPHESQAVTWDISASQPEAPVVTPTFGS